METRREWRASSSRARSLLFRVIRFLLVLFLVFLAVDALLVSSIRVGAQSMEPTLAPGDRLLVTPLPYGPKLPAFGVQLPGLRRPTRGDIVILEAPFAGRRSFVVHAADAVVSFFTARRVSFLDREQESRWVVKRIVAVPGDTVRVEDFVAFVRPVGESAFASELTTARYQVDRDGLPNGWSAALPLSGHYGEVTLGPNEYFVLGDNRLRSLDSRHWGPVGADSIRALALLRYWPLHSFGRP